MKRPEINQETKELIKEFEGLRLNAYLDSAGVPTIGYGLTTDALDGVVVRLGMVITKKEADEYFDRAIEVFANGIWEYFKVQPTENQFGAFVSLAYNIGIGAFSRSTALKRFNNGDITGAAEAIKWWNKATVKGKKTILKGLVRRRAAEVDLFLKDEYEPVRFVEEAPPEMPEKVAAVMKDAEKHPIASTTNLASVAQIATAVGVPGTLTAFGQMDWKVAAILMVGGFVIGGYIILERNRKSKLAKEAREEWESSTG